MNESLYVDKFYVAQSDYDDIVFGKDLRDGMIVLIEDGMVRADPANLRSMYDRQRADEMNRWCEVTRLEVMQTRDWPMVRFVGVYPDGSMRVRTYAASYGWIVKREPPQEAES